MPELSNNGEPENHQIGTSLNNKIRLEVANLLNRFINTDYERPVSEWAAAEEFNSIKHDPSYAHATFLVITGAIDKDLFSHPMYLDRAMSFLSDFDENIGGGFNGLLLKDDWIHDLRVKMISLLLNKADSWLALSPKSYELLCSRCLGIDEMDAIADRKEDEDGEIFVARRISGIKQILTNKLNELKLE